MPYKRLLYFSFLLASFSFESALCDVHSMQSEHTTNVPRVNVVQFVMAKCPMTTTLHNAFSKDIMNTSLREMVNFTQTFVGGDIGEGPVNESNWMHCFHGPSECDGHKYMLCAAHVCKQHSKYFDYQWFDMVSYAVIRNRYCL